MDPDRRSFGYRGVDLRPNLYRVAVTVLTVALAANFLLLWVAFDRDAFIWIISIASIVAAAAMLVTAFVPAAIRLREESFILAIAVWVANGIEFATEEGPAVDSKLRQVSIYAALAVLAAGTYLAQQLERTDDDA